MKVRIDEIADGRDSLAALGLRTLIASLGIAVEPVMLPGGMAGFGLPAPSRAAAEEPEEPAVAKKAGRGRPKRTFRPLKNSPSASAADESPRITIRQRMLTMLGPGAMYPSDILKALIKQGQSNTIDVHQHGYIMKKAGLIVCTDEGKYELVR